MKLDGRRESSNVEDRRGMSGGTAAGLGLGGVALIALIVLLQGGSLGDVVKSVINSGGMQTTQQTNYEPTAENEALAKFSRQILASTEDVWSAYFRQNGIGTYRTPTLVLYSGATATACGPGQAAMGPFYCSGDEKLYIEVTCSADGQQAKAVIAGSHTRFVDVEEAERIGNGSDEGCSKRADKGRRAAFLRSRCAGLYRERALQP